MKAVFDRVAKISHRQTMQMYKTTKLSPESVCPHQLTTVQKCVSPKCIAMPFDFLPFIQMLTIFKIFHPNVKSTIIFSPCKCNVVEATTALSTLYSADSLSRCPEQIHS